LLKLVPIDPPHNPLPGNLSGCTTMKAVERNGAVGLLQRSLLIAICLILLSSAGLTGPRKTETPPFSASQFAELIERISEEDGTFWNDNYVSNEASYLHPLTKMQELGIHGGVYIGVGPNQNFTYIAKVRPRYAFIVDIRRQNSLEHLLFKSLFHLSHDRAQYLSLLLSRPISPGIFEDGSYTVEDLVRYFEKAPADPSLFTRTQSDVRGYLESSCRLNLTERDWSTIDRIHLAFYARGLAIKYDYIPVPTYGEFLVEKDLEGRMQNFLNSAEDFGFVKQMEEENRIVPVVGDFSGSHALKELGSFLKEKDEKITVFYASNVEQYLIRDMTWPDFIDNLKQLPFDDRALFIRTHWSNYIPHPEEVPGYQFTQILQWVKLFLNAVPPNRSLSYWDIVTTDTIKLR
jgi:hypothetical protein